MDIDNLILLHNRFIEIFNKLAENENLEYEPNEKYIHKEFKLECIVCYNNVKSYDCKKSMCNHNLCKACYKKWDLQCLKNNVITTCPICRNILK
jgi:hypothetical protein